MRCEVTRVGGSPEVNELRKVEDHSPHMWFMLPVE